MFPLALELRLVSGPREVGVGGTNGLGQVMRKQRRVLVPAAAGALQPRRDAGMETRSPRFREARLGDFPSQRVRDRVLALSGERRRRPAPDEAPAFEHVEVRNRVSD